MICRTADTYRNNGITILLIICRLGMTGRRCTWKGEAARTEVVGKFAGTETRRPIGVGRVCNNGGPAKEQQRGTGKWIVSIQQVRP